MILRPIPGETIRERLEERRQLLSELLDQRARARLCVPAERSFVYFVRDDKFVKIGRASNLSSRLKGLLTGTPRQLQLVAFDLLQDEGFWHRRFWGDHWRGEWFHYSSDIKQVTADLVTGLESIVNEFDAILDRRPRCNGI